MMRGKIVLIAGLGIGYVLGARAGRERYEDIKRVACRFWNSPRVTQRVRSVEQFAKDKAPDVVDFIGDTAKKVIQRTPAEDSTKASASSSAGSTKKATTASATKSTSSTAPSTSSKK